MLGKGCKTKFSSLQDFICHHLKSQLIIHILLGVVAIIPFQPSTSFSVENFCFCFERDNVSDVEIVCSLLTALPHTEHTHTESHENFA